MNMANSSILACFTLVLRLLQLAVLEAYACEPNTYVDVDPIVRSHEQFEKAGSCAYLRPSTPVCPEGYEEVGSISQRCGNWMRQTVIVCQACSIRREVVPKEVLTSCEFDHTTWCGFAPNDIADPKLSELLGGLWYLDGNKAKEEAFSFHGSIWSQEDSTLEQKIYKGRNWALGDGDGIIAPSNDLAITYIELGIGLRFKFNLTAANQSNAELASIGVFFSLDLVQSFFSPLLDSIWNNLDAFDWKLYTTSDPNILLRTTGEGEPQYTVRRFVSPEGRPVERNFAIWKADVFQEPRPDTGAVREVPYPMQTVWLNSKVGVAECPDCSVTKRCIGNMRVRGLCAP